MRLRMHGGGFRKEQVAVLLVRFRLLRVAVDDDDSIENRSPATRRNASIHLLAAATRRSMLDQRVVVDVISAIDEVSSVELTLRAPAHQ